MDSPLEFPCPTCRVLPGENCRMRDEALTPLQYASGTNVVHGARILKAASHNRRMVKKRGYSDEFPTTRPKRVYFMLDKIPPALWIRVQAKAKREGVSLRALILGWCQDWIDK